MMSLSSPFSARTSQPTRSDDPADQAEVSRAALMIEGRTVIPDRVMAITKGDAPAVP